jgi:protoporphyrinogen oxidase
VRVAVIGAGVAGLTASYRLSQLGHTCDVYERWPGLGGQAATLDVGGGALLERYYHHLFPSDRHIAELYAELSLREEIEWHSSSMAVFANGRQWRFDGPADLLRFGPLDIWSRVRMGLALLALQRSRDVAGFESVTARTWTESHMGAASWRAVWGPLLRAKFGDRADAISMAWLWSKLVTRRRLGGREIGRERLGYPRHSWGTLFETLRDAIESAGGRVMIDRAAARLGRAGAEFAVDAAASGAYRAGLDPHRFPRSEVPAERYDAVIATVPSDVFLELLDDDLADAIGTAYLDLVRAVEYRTALCLLLEIDRQFSPYYWTNIADPGIPFVGLIEHTNLIDPERYGGRRFLYVANYLAPDDPLLDLDADRLLAAYLAGLQKIRPGFTAEWVRARWLHREPAAQPVVELGYHKRIPPLRTGVPGLVLANTTQIYPEDRGTNYSVRLGAEAAAAVTNPDR